MRTVQRLLACVLAALAGGCASTPAVPGPRDAAPAVDHLVRIPEGTRWMRGTTELARVPAPVFSAEGRLYVGLNAAWGPLIAALGSQGLEVEKALPLCAGAFPPLGSACGPNTASGARFGPSAGRHVAVLCLRKSVHGGEDVTEDLVELVELPRTTVAVLEKRFAFREGRLVATAGGEPDAAVVALPGQLEPVSAAPPGVVEAAGGRLQGWSEVALPLAERDALLEVFRSFALRGFSTVVTTSRLSEQPGVSTWIVNQEDLPMVAPGSCGKADPGSE